jgi:hypothetical protein
MNLRIPQFSQSLCMTLASTSNTMSAVKSKTTCSIDIVCFSFLFYQTYSGTWWKSKSDGVDDAFRFKCPLSCTPFRATTRKSTMGDSLNLDISVESNGFYNTMRHIVRITEE